ncbi:MAG TPA: HD domain-containing phosphohydrolase [Burkholderiales bacterium]|jgi:HD-GYP domain-containing protein (c-di-GMP phosphodiesterase class II)
MQRKQVTVGELQFGMFVAELDRPWTETPFMFQGFHLRTDKQLEALKKHCKHVFIDLEKTEKADPRPPPAEFKIRGQTKYVEQVKVEVEYQAAAAVYSRSAVKVEELLKPVAKPGGVLDAKDVKESVTHLTDSVVRNPDAMLLVTRLREKSAAAHARALQVSIYMIVFGRFLELAREELELLGMVGLLQDVGKTRLPASVMEKNTTLTPEEAEIFKSHVQLGAEILKTTPGIPPRLLELAILHHERQDGTGYPKGLKGEQIGLYGSIAAIADAFDILTAQRTRGDPLSPSAALSYLYKERGTGYHSDLVEQFIQCVGVFPVGSVVELNSGETGLVITQNLVRRLKPRVMIVLDGKGNPMRPHKILDLDRDPKWTPEEPYRIKRTLEQTKLQVNPKELFM